MKFLHAADLHLDSPLGGLERYEGAPVDLIRGATRRALENLVRLAIFEKVDFVVIAGDLYDGDWRDFNTGMFFGNQMNTLRDAGISVYLIAGNHDAASNMNRKLRLPTNPDGQSIMLSCEQPETRRIDNLGVAIHGRSFAIQAETRNMVPDYPAAISHWFNIGLLHTSLSGCEEHDTYAPCTPADLRFKGYDYWALGHIHKRSLLPGDGVPQEAPLALFSGNTQGRHIRELGPKGCLLVSVDSSHRAEVLFRPLDVFRWGICPVACDGLATMDDVLEQCREQLSLITSINEGLPMGVRVRLEGATNAHQQLSRHRSGVTAEIRSMATAISNGQVWVEQVKMVTTETRESKASFANSGPLGELRRYLDEMLADPELRNGLLDELKDLARKLPTEVMEPGGLLLNDAEWVGEVIEELKPMLLDRFPGA